MIKIGVMSSRRVCAVLLTFIYIGLVLSLSQYSAKGVALPFVYNGDPFRPGPFPVNTRILNKDRDHVPLHIEIYYPTSPGTYVPILFVPGLNGVVFPEFYSTVMANFAAYGYIIAGIDPYYPALAADAREEIVKSIPEETFKVLKWLEDNLVQKVLPSSEGGGNVTASWGDLGILSHSLGGDTLIQMLQQNHTFAKAAAFLEPGSNHFNKPLGFSIPSLCYGTQLCMEFPQCCIKGDSYFHFYDNLECPKILMNVTDYGHCDILNEFPGWEACHLSNFCKTDKSNNRKLYREVFVPGVLAAFFGNFTQGNKDIIKHIVTRDLMPVELGDLKADLCTH